MVDIIRNSGGEEGKSQMRAMNREISGVTPDGLRWDWHIRLHTSPHT